jgi:predicted S18 family serine protease
MTAYDLAKELIKFMTEDSYTELDKSIFESANMLRQQAKKIEKLEKSLAEEEIYSGILEAMNKSTSQIKELSDEELNKAFDYYCETDEGVLRFNYELRDEWKKEQLIRWKEALKKASKK